MKIDITYITKKTKLVKTKAFYRANVHEALEWFKWRYGHKILDIKTQGAYELR